MPVYDDPLTSLAACVRGGDQAALAGLRQELEPRLTRVVQQVMRLGPGRSALDRKIARELAVSARTHPGSPRDGQALAAQVAGRVCAAVLDGLRAPAPRPQGFKDTVRDL
jgi:hypothetical protein